MIVPNLVIQEKKLILNLKNRLFNMKQYTIGRSSDNDFTIDDASVSRHHAKIIQTASGIVICDNGSSNGTFINGNRINQESPLKKNDILKLGTALVPWMNYVGLQEESNSHATKVIKEEAQRSIPRPVQEKVINVPPSPKKVGNSGLRKFFGIIFLFIGLIAIGAGILAVTEVETRSQSVEDQIDTIFTEGHSERNSNQEEGGLILVGGGLFFLIMGIIRISTKSRSQVRAEAALITANTYQSAIINNSSSNSNSSDIYEQLEKLGRLRDQGVISEEEFQTQKNRLMN
jgi:hypothetical protein